MALALFADVTLFRWALASALECGFFPGNRVGGFRNCNLWAVVI